MSTEPLFDDPVLKASLKGALGDEKPPAELRMRLARLMAESENERIAPLRIAGGGDVRGGRPFWRRSTWGLALAAMLAIVVLGALRALLWPGSGQLQAAGLDREVVLGMIKCHQDCCARGDHRHPDTAMDVRLLARELEQKLHATVLAANLSEDGWELCGADVCQSCGRQSAHLVFSRRAARMSVFSVPIAIRSQVEEGKVYAECIDGYMVAGFVRNGMVYGMVGHCPNKNLKLSEVADLMRKHQGELVYAAAASLSLIGPDYH